MGIFVIIVNDLLPCAVVTKNLLSEVVLVALLVVPACLGRIKGVHDIVMSRGVVQFPSQYTPGFVLGDESKCRLCDVIQVKRWSFV